MGNNGDANGRLRFEDFELDLRTRELYINGTKVTLQEQPFQVLIALLEHPGGLVTREELRQRLWSSDTFVNFDLSLNKAVNRLRDVLQASAQTPHLIETLPRRGYRYVGRLPENPSNGGATAGGLIGAESHPVSRVAKNPGWSLLSLVRILIWMTLLGVTVFIAFSVLRYSPPVVLQAQPITKDGRAKATYATVATDGSRVYFEEVVAGREIAAQVSIAGGETAEIPIPMKGTIADISPDGSRMLFGAEMPGGIQLWLQPLPTGPANRIGDFSAIDAGWAPDGLSFVFVTSREVFWAKADGSGVRKIATTEGNSGWPRVSPDDKKIRLTVANPTGSAQTIWEVSRDGSALRPLLHQWFKDGNQCCGRWTDDGKYFIFQNVGDTTSDLWVLPEARNWPMRSRNKPIRLTYGPVNFFLPQPSRDGKTIFAIGQQLGSELVRFNVHSKVFLPYLGGISATSVVISPDERWAAYVAYPEGTLWRCRVDGSERQRLTESTMKVERPHWSPDGSQIAFVASPRGSPSSGFVVSANGGPITRILPDGGIGSLWSNDGTKIAFNYFEHGKSADDRDWVQIRIMDLGTKKISLVPHSEGLFLADWSRDGKFLLAKTSDHHRGLLFEVSTEQWTMFREAEMLTNLRFSRNADYIYFESTSANHAALMRMRIADHKIEQVMDFQNIRRPLTQLSSAWTGLANDDSPIMQRDIGTQEVYALHWRVP